MEISSKAWSTMTKEEKQEAMKDIAKLRGYAKSWKEIAEYYGSVESTIKQAYNTFVKTTEKTEKSCKDILNETSVNISDELLTKLLERIESLELEVASVKRLQVENAAIERLDDTEYKFFVKNRKTNEEFKFRDAIELAKFVSEFKGCKFTDKFFVDSTGILKPNASDIYPLLITQCFKNDNDNMTRELDNWKIEGKLLQTELENIKSNL